jgi:hypothetical protein
MKARWLAVITAFALGGATSASAQPSAPLFESSDPLQLTIKAPLTALTRNRAATGAIAGTLADGTGQTLPISLQMRGITRRTSEICDFPPLRVDFTAPPPPNSPFVGQKKLKLVTHCRNSASFQQNLLLEYAAYRLYNVLTPRSFRVRLANISYQGPDGRPIAQRAAFFIEDLKDVARRNGTRETKAPPRIAVTELSPPDAARYAMFEHMIGNHDWSMRAGPAGENCCHNAKLIGAEASGSVIPIPYDFDYSGFVSAPYATPPAELPIQDVHQRFYRGYCSHNGYALAAARQIRDARPQLLAALSQVPGLDGRSQGRAAAYLDKFFADIGSDADVQSKILNRCAA